MRRVWTGLLRLLVVGAVVWATGCSVPDVIVADGMVADASQDEPTLDVQGADDSSATDIVPAQDVGADTNAPDAGSDAVVNDGGSAPDVASTVDGSNAADGDTVADVATSPDVPPAMDLPILPDVPLAMDLPVTIDTAVMDVHVATDTFVCPAGAALCGSACVVLSMDPVNCGRCGATCAFPNAAAVCAGGVCAVGLCAPGYGNCDGVASNGCETDVRVSTTHCGRCGNPCTVPSDGTVGCVAGACSVTCNAGYMVAGGACVPVPPPRQLAPLSTATVTRRTPILHWQLAGGTDGAHIELSRTRSFARVEVAFDAAGSSGSPATDLTAGAWFWRAYGRTGTSVGTTVGATWEFTVGARSAPLDASYGTTVDVNGDGYADIVVGATYRNAAFLYFGGPSGVPLTPSESLTGPDGGLFGWVVASAGDVNGDGYGDLVVGAPFAGRAYLYLGGTAGIPTTPTTTWSPPAGISGFGRGLSSVGDINRDGYADVVVGSGSDRAYVYFGSPTGIAATPSVTLNGPTGSNFSDVIVGLGDVNGDGYADIVSSGSGASQAYVFLGNAGGVPTTASVTLSSPDGSAFGGVVVALSDVNGDGLTDLMVSDQRSALGWIYRGASPFTGSVSSMFRVRQPGSSMAIIAGVSDIDGDGFSDIAVADSAMGHGVLSIVRGGIPPLTGEFSYVLNSSVGTDLRALTGLGDLNDDGIADVGVGVAAAAYVDVHLGSFLNPHSDPDFVLFGPGSSSFGWCVAAASSPSTPIRGCTHIRATGHCLSPTRVPWNDRRTVTSLSWPKCRSTV